MPETMNHQNKNLSGANNSDKSSSVVDEVVTARLLQIVGNQNSYTPTQAQVDKLLALQEKGMDYTHKERTAVYPKQKIEFSIFSIIIVVFLVIFILSLFYAKEYLGEIISGTVGFLAGGTGGYGLAHAKRKDNTL